MHNGQTTRSEEELAIHCRSTWLSMQSDPHSEEIVREIDAVLENYSIMENTEVTAPVTQATLDQAFERFYATVDTYLAQRSDADQAASRSASNGADTTVVGATLAQGNQSIRNLPDVETMDDWEAQRRSTGQPPTSASREPTLYDCRTPSNRVNWMQANNDESGEAFENSCVRQFGVDYRGVAPAQTGQVAPGGDGSFYGDNDPRNSRRSPQATVPPQSQSFSLANPLRNIDSIPKLLATILNVIAVLAVPVVIFFIMLAGFHYVTAQGNPEKIKGASNALLYAIIGAVLIFGGMVIAQILQNLVDSFRA
jgi:hypothetical protein